MLLKLWNASLRLAMVALFLYLLTEVGTFSVRQSVVLVLAAWLIVEVARSGRQQPIHLTVCPHWRPICELLKASSMNDHFDAKDIVDFPQITLTALKSNLWFNSESATFTTQPIFSERIRVFDSPDGDPVLSCAPSRTGLEIAIDFYENTEAARFAENRLAASGYSAEKHRVRLASLPRQAFTLALQDKDRLGWILFGGVIERRLKGVMERFGWRGDLDWDSQSWDSSLVSVRICKLV